MVAQFGFAERCVAFFLQDFEGVNDTGIDPRGGVIGEAEIDGDAISGLEPDPLDLPRDPIGLVHQNVFRIVAETINELHALRGRHAVGLQKDVELALNFLFVPRLLDASDPFFTDARDIP